MQIISILINSRLSDVINFITAIVLPTIIYVLLMNYHSDGYLPKNSFKGISGFNCPDRHIIVIIVVHGAVAHSGEHFLCKEGVRGSNPLSSTKNDYPAAISTCVF